MTAKRERALVCALAVVLVLVRSFVATYYEGFYFDSDQAIVGLMARHLSRFQTFPLFYYGLNYMLGVEAWIIAPLFAVGRSSVQLARLPFVFLNAVVAVWLIDRLSVRNGVRPAVAFVAALPFIVPTPAVSGQLLELAGSCVEPFVYVLLLWTVRRRPLAFGLLLAVAYLHREFTVFTLPAIVLVECWRREFWTLETARRFGWMLAGFAIVWFVVDDLKMHLIGNGLIGQAASLRGQMCTTLPELVPRVRAMAAEALPILYGGASMPIAAARMRTPVVAGSWVTGVIVGVTLAVVVVRLAQGVGRRFRVAGEPRNDPRPPVDIGRHGDQESRFPGNFGPSVRNDPRPLVEIGNDPRPPVENGFGAYLALVGLFTALAYPLSCNVSLHTPPLLRYLLLALLLPIGCFVAFAQRERSRAIRTVAITGFVLWAAMNLVDNVRLIRESLREAPFSEHRALVDYLLQQRIRYARAIYWDAYVIDFLSAERVITASVDIVRIPEYQKQVEEHAGAAVTLERQPCEGGTKVSAWCVTR